MTEADMFLWIAHNADKVEWKTDSALHPEGVWVIVYRLPGNKLRGTSASPSLSDAIELAEKRRTEYGLSGTLRP